MGNIDSREYFVSELMALVPADEPNRRLFEADANRIYNEGWSLVDAKSYFLCFEEITPGLDEDTACTRMEILQRKTRTPRIPSPTH